MTANFRVLALTYKTAPVSVREQVSLNEAGSKQLLNFLKEFTSVTEALVVSTCNRTEIYYSSEVELTELLFKAIRMIKNPDAGFERHFAKYEGQAAVAHLFEVALGLDAQVIGDFQISGQVKSAYQWTADENMAGPFLHRLLHTIFFANKRVAQETAFRDGAASLSYAAKELAEDLTVSVKNPKVLVVGVGEIGQDVCLNLQNSAFTDVTVINRTIEKAERLAIKSGFQFKGIDCLVEEVAKADVIISSVSGTEPLITRNVVGKKPLVKNKFFIDLSIPRSIEAAIDEMPGAILYNLDDIQQKTNEAVEKRKASIPHVQRIVKEAMTEFEDWSKEMIVSPTIQKLKNSLEQIRKEELARFLKNATPEEAAKLDEMSRSMMQKVIKYPVLHLKAACKRGDAESLSELLQQLFDLDKTAAKKP